MVKSNHQLGNAFSALCLVAGSCIGIGILAIPSLSFFGGLFPAWLASLFCWFLMTSTGLLLLETAVWMPDKAHMMSMVERILGSRAKYAIGALFLGLYLCLLIAYFHILTPLLGLWFEKSSLFQPFAKIISGNNAPVLVAFFISLVVFLGYRVIDRVNLILLIGLLSLFLVLIIMSSQVSTEEEFAILPVGSLLVLGLPFSLISAYRYHHIIPSITTYLGKNYKSLRWGIVLGTTLSLALYTVWQLMVTSSIPTEILGKHFLQDSFPTNSIPNMPKLGFIEKIMDVTGIEFLSRYANMAEKLFFVKIADYFMAFALTTSFLGISFALVDFLGDGLNISRQGISRCVLCLSVTLIPFAISRIAPTYFLLALGYLGGIAEVFLWGILPPILVWVGKNRLGLKTECQFIGRNFFLLLTLFFSFSLLGLEVFRLLFG